MNDKKVLQYGVIGTIIAALCCFTPVLAVLLPVLGLGAWLATADSIVVTLLVASLGLVAVGLYRYRYRAAALPAARSSLPKKD